MPNWLTREKDKYKLIFDLSPEAIIIIDPKGNIVDINDRIYDWLGFKPEMLIGKNIKEAPFFNEESSILAEANFRKRMMGKDIPPYELEFITKNGGKVIGRVTGTQIIEKDKKIAGVIIMISDISKEKQAEVEKERIDRAKIEFTSIASHQLRTPLSVMAWYIEMLSKGRAGSVNNQQKKYLDEISDANNTLVKLVNMLLNISRIELGTFVINPARVNLIETMNGIIKDLSAQIKAKKLRIEKKYLKSPIFIYSDQNIINIIFQNLLSNSILYSRERSKVVISIRKEEPYVLIKVLDTGYGIPKIQQSQVFSKFFRAENIKGKDTRGSGLGLYITKAVIEYLGGEIWFESKEEKGTSFYVKIPSKIKEERRRGKNRKAAETYEVV